MPPFQNRRTVRLFEIIMLQPPSPLRAELAIDGVHRFSRSLYLAARTLQRTGLDFPLRDFEPSPARRRHKNQTLFKRPVHMDAMNFRRS